MNIKNRALRVGIATIVAQLFSALGFLIIPSLFTTSDYGELVLVLSVVSILQPLATLRIEILTSVVDSEQESIKLIEFVKKLSLLVSLGSFSVFFFFFYVYRNYTGIESIRISLFVSTIIFFQSRSIILVQANLRSQRLNSVALSGVIQNSSTLILQVLFGWFKLGSTFLIIAYILGRILGIIPLEARFKTDRQKRKILSKTSFTSLKPFIKPAGFLFTSGIMDAAILSIPLLFIVREFGYSQAGSIGYLQNILLVPVTLSVSMLAAGLFSNSKHLHKMNLQGARFLLWSEIRHAYNWYIGIFIATFTLLLPFFLSRFFQSEWQINSRIHFLLTINFALYLFLVPDTTLLITMHKFSIVWMSSVLKFVTGTLSCVISIIIKPSLDQFLITYYGTQIICSVALLIIYRRHSNT